MKKIKRLSALIISALLIVTIISSVSVSADTFIETDEFKFRLEPDNTLYIADYYINNSTMVIPDTDGSRPVVGITPHAFMNDDFIEHIVFGKNFKTLAALAFSGSTALKDVVLPETMTKLVWGAFQNCTALTDVTVLESQVTAIPELCFDGCTALKNVTLNNNITTIGKKAFSNCTSLEKLVIPASVTSIDSTAFLGSTNITLYCYADSYALQYAIDNNIDYVIIDNVDKTELYNSILSAEEILNNIYYYLPSSVSNLQNLYNNALSVYNDNNSTQQQVNDADDALQTALSLAKQYEIGDVDLDGEFNIYDATMIQLYCAELESLSDIQLKLADYNGDGEVNIIDATTIQLVLAEMT